MNVSLNWISDYLSVAPTADAVEQALTQSGLEVEEVTFSGLSLEGVVIGHVLEARTHPNADRLTLCQVDIGRDVPSSIVCGAPNVAAGQKVAVATLGTTLHLPGKDGAPVPVVMERRKIRGELSEGMICAEDELGLGTDHSGIMVLNDNAVPGMPFADYLASVGRVVSDAVLDLSITPNRPDATCHIGVARDLSALFGCELRLPEVAVPEAGGEAAERVSVHLHAPDACPRYVAVLVDGVTVRESPEWLKSRLQAIGVRPISNVVDVTNFVLHECGQPLHAFDADQLAGSAIHVRTATAGATFTTLDGKSRTLPEGALLICDAEKPVALAGIMGGENSEVTASTTRLLIESAYFEPTGIRKTSKVLGLQSDSSYRFERGIDPTRQRWAAARAAELIVQVAGGRIVPGCVDADAKPYVARTVPLRHSRLRQILGADIPAADIERLLTAIGFGLESAGSDAWTCTVPPFRPDVSREIDVIEEVVRLWGLDRLPMPEQISLPPVAPKPDREGVLREAVRDALVGAGYAEVFCNSLMPLSLAETWAGDAARVLQTLNPISQDMAALRPSLMPNALQTLRHNQANGQFFPRVFEMGHVFGAASYPTLVPGVDERENVVAFVQGPANEAHWHVPSRPTDVYDVLGLLPVLSRTLRLPLEVRPEEPDARFSQRVSVVSGKTVVGAAGVLEPARVREAGIEGAVFGMELELSALLRLALQVPTVRYSAFSRFPTVERDLAFLIPTEVAVGDVLRIIRQRGGAFLRDVSVFDVYAGDKLPPNMRSVAFRLIFGADKTLKDVEVEKAVHNVIQVVSRQFGAQHRA